jgi:hypothetical protein
MSAIVIAIMSRTIIDLPLTCKLLRKDIKNLVNQMDNFLDPHDNYNKYKAMLKNSNPPPCIPWLGKRTTSGYTNRD